VLVICSVTMTVLISRAEKFVLHWRTRRGCRMRIAFVWLGQMGRPTPRI
jgi:hypothetical protein